MDHLGRLLPALVDGTLGPADTERLLAHVAGCSLCRRELEAAREVAALLGTLEVSEPSASLMGRLYAMSAERKARPVGAHPAGAGPSFPRAWFARRLPGRRSARAPQGPGPGPRPRALWQAFTDGFGGVFDVFGGARRQVVPVPPFEATLTRSVRELLRTLEPAPGDQGADG
ncbi:zf-HC2 domain-containing protein [Actinomadura scrupuli]|uniref:zf-HC2 domain-containing protein n=1 Tax=Actinomadura scrupuli TaxID=559629 RepID=UPI003D976F44